MSAADVRALLGRYDDAALEALASRGLLRRARKEVAAEPPLVRDDGDDVVVEAGGQVVRFGASGAVGASCSCPALGVCQHVLAGVLAVASVASGGGDTAADPGAAPSDLGPATGSLPPGPGDALAAVPHADLLAHAGLPGYRWAWQRVAEGEPRVEESEAGVVVRFVRPTVLVTYLGGPLEAMLLDPAQRAAERYRVGAAIAYQRHRGVDVVEPPPVRGRAAGGGSVGPDDASAQVEARARVRAGVAALVGECVQLGLAHLSASVRERFVALASTAQASGYHRLSLLARRLGEHVDLLLQRHASADEHRLLDELAVAAALVAALERAEASGAVPVALLGRARGRFDETGTLDLVGLGAWPWRSASGYTGLTVLFADPSDGTFLTWTDARPLGVAGLDPLARHRAPGPWPGLASPAAATGRRVLLAGARASEAGRLSAAEGISATVAAVSGDLGALLAPVRSWDDARRLLAAAGTGLLAASPGAGAWAVLAPAGFGEAVFDESRQVVSWPLVDGAGETLVAEIAHGPYTAAAVARVEALSADTAPGTLVVARLVATASGVVAEPVSVVHPEAGPDGVRVEALAFPHGGGGAGLVDAAGHGAGAVVPAAGPAGLPAALSDGPVDVPVAVPAPVRDLRAWLQATSERGLSPASLPAAAAELARLAAWASSAGLTLLGPFAVPASSVPELAERIVKAHVLCLQYERAAASRSGGTGGDGSYG